MLKLKRSVVDKVINHWQPRLMACRHANNNTFNSFVRK